MAFYSDKHSVFRVNQTGTTSGTGLTQFGRALHDLNIDILYANSSPAKVERSKKAPTRRGQRQLARERFRETNPAAL